MQFQRVMSLGAWCQAAYQIRRRYGVKAQSPFDWLVTPHHSLIKMLRDRCAGLGTDIAPNAQGTVAVCQAYGVTYDHEFYKDADGKLILTDMYLERCRSKLAHKTGCLLALNETKERTLFVRLGGFADPPQAWATRDDSRYPEAYSSGHLNQITSALDEVFPGLEYELAFVHIPRFSNVDFSGALDPRIRTHALATPSHHDWRGDDDAWDKVFDAYDVEIAAPLTVTSLASSQA